MKIIVINGPNLNMLGIREPDIYGNKDYRALCSFIKGEAKKRGVKVKIVQRNGEGRLITIIQKCYRKYDGMIVNAGGYTHTSVAIADAIKASGVPAVEVHLTDITKREAFRKNSFLSACVEKTIQGKGFDGYGDAIEYLSKRQDKENL